jgi:hypothetical protein
MHLCQSFCIGVFRKTSSVTHKKSAGRLIVRTEEVVNSVRQRQDPTKHTK